MAITATERRTREIWRRREKQAPYGGTTPKGGSAREKSAQPRVCNALGVWAFGGQRCDSCTRSAQWHRIAVHNARCQRTPVVKHNMQMHDKVGRNEKKGGKGPRNASSAAPVPRTKLPSLGPNQAPGGGGGSATIMRRGHAWHTRARKVVLELPGRDTRQSERPYLGRKGRRKDRRRAKLSWWQRRTPPYELNKLSPTEGTKKRGKERKEKTRKEGKGDANGDLPAICEFHLSLSEPSLGGQDVVVRELGERACGWETDFLQRYTRPKPFVPHVRLVSEILTPMGPYMVFVDMKL
ncbi:hypothetical protein FB451DRAFT_1193498 [Mycena latifolia]|nr:hypothetical protein FB451DRAFT_1193498 [Mycena latifolia]